MRLMDMKVGLPLAAIVVAVVGVGCTASSTGRISGTGSPCNGVTLLQVERSLPVQAVQGDKVVASATVMGPRFAFTFKVHSGIYQVSAPGDATQTVVVRRGKTSTVALSPICQ